MAYLFATEELHCGERVGKSFKLGKFFKSQSHDSDENAHKSNSLIIDTNPAINVIRLVIDDKGFL